MLNELLAFLDELLAYLESIRVVLPRSQTQTEVPMRRIGLAVVLV